MNCLISVFYFFLLSLISFQVFALDTLLGDEDEGFYFNWPEKEWKFEAEERKENRQTLSLLKIQQEPFPERAVLTAEPRPEEGFSVFFDSYLKNEKKKIPEAEIEILPQNIKGEYDNRLFVLYDRKQEGHSSATVILLLQGQRFLYCVKIKTDFLSSRFVKNSAAFLLKGCILDSQKLLQLRKQRMEMGDEKIKEIKAAERKAFESDAEELISLVGDEGDEEKGDPAGLTVFNFEKQRKKTAARSHSEKSEKNSSLQKGLAEERMPVGETAITSETEKLSIVWDAAEDWTILSAPVPEAEEVEVEEGESAKSKSIRVYHSQENENNWTETGEMKISGGPLKEGESADEFLEEYIHKIFQDELKNDPQASLQITEDQFAETDASRIFIIRATKEKVPNIQFYLILFGNKGFYEINRKKLGEEVFTIPVKKFINFLKTAKLTDAGLTGSDAQKSGDEDMDENRENSEKSDQDDTDSEDGKEGDEDLDTSTDTDTLTDIITDTDTDTGTGTETKTDTDTITDTETLTDTNTRTGTGSNTGTKRDTDTRTDTDTLTDIITDTNTETGTGTGTKTDTDTITDTETLTNTDTRTGTGSNTGTKRNTDTRTDTDTFTDIITDTNTETLTDTNTGTGTWTRTFTSSGTGSSTGTKRDTGTRTRTDTDTLTDIITDTNTETFTDTNTGTGTGTSIYTQTRTNTKTGTNTSTSTKIITRTSTSTETATSTGTKTSTNTHTREDTSIKTSTGTSTDITEDESKAMEQQEQQEEADKTNKMFDDQRRTLIKKHLGNVLETKGDYESKSGNSAASSRRNYRLNAEEQDWGQAKITINDIEKRRKEFNDLMSKTEEEE